MHFPLFNSNPAVVVLTHMLHLVCFFSCLFLVLDLQQNRNRSSTFSSTDKEKKKTGSILKDTGFSYPDGGGHWRPHY